LIDRSDVHRGSQQEVDGRREVNRKALPQVLLATGIIIAGIFLSKLPVDYAKLARFGYAGIFFAALIGSGTIFLPGPTLPMIFAGSMMLNPFWVGIVGGLGSALGESVGYFAGNRGRAGVRDSEEYQRIEGWVKRYGVIAIFALAVIPNPLFDLAGLTAGAAGLDVMRFFVPTLLGRLVRSFYVAYFGAYLGRGRA
jgi:membrane protein YqaA with SNARE-associated domain